MKFSFEQHLFGSDTHFRTVGRSAGIDRNIGAFLEGVARRYRVREQLDSPPIVFRALPLPERDVWSISLLGDARSSGGRAGNYHAHSFVIPATVVRDSRWSMAWIAAHLPFWSHFKSSADGVDLLDALEGDFDPSGQYRFVPLIVDELGIAGFATLVDQLVKGLATDPPRVVLSMPPCSPAIGELIAQHLEERSRPEPPPADVLRLWRLFAALAVIPDAFRQRASFSINEAVAPRLDETSPWSVTVLDIDSDAAADHTCPFWLESMLSPAKVEERANLEMRRDRLSALLTAPDPAALDPLARLHALLEDTPPDLDSRIASISAALSALRPHARSCDVEPLLQLVLSRHDSAVDERVLVEVYAGLASLCAGARSASATGLLDRIAALLQEGSVSLQSRTQLLQRLPSVIYEGLSASSHGASRWPRPHSRADLELMVRTLPYADELTHVRFAGRILDHIQHLESAELGASLYARASHPLEDGARILRGLFALPIEASGERVIHALATELRHRFGYRNGDGARIQRLIAQHVAAAQAAGASSRRNACMAFLVELLVEAQTGCPEDLVAGICEDLPLDDSSFALLEAVARSDRFSTARRRRAVLEAELRRVVSSGPEPVDAPLPAFARLVATAWSVGEFLNGLRGQPRESEDELRSFSAHVAELLRPLPTARWLECAGAYLSVYPGQEDLFRMVNDTLAARRGAVLAALSQSMRALDGFVALLAAASEQPKENASEFQRQCLWALDAMCFADREAVLIEVAERLSLRGTRSKDWSAVMKVSQRTWGIPR